MATLDASMGKNPNKPLSAQAHLSPEDYKALKKLADAKKWSVKKYLEDLLEKHLKENRKAK